MPTPRPSPGQPAPRPRRLPAHRLRARSRLSSCPRALRWCRRVAGVKRPECFYRRRHRCVYLSACLCADGALTSGCFCAGVMGPCVPSRRPLYPQPLPGSQLPHTHTPAPTRSSLCQGRRPQGCLFSPRRLLGFCFSSPVVGEVYISDWFRLERKKRKRR